MPRGLKSDGWNDMPIPPCVFLQSLRTGIPRRESGGFHWAIPKLLRNSKIKQRASPRLIISLVRSPIRRNLSQQGRKGHKEKSSVSDLCDLCDLVELPVATNGLAIAKCRVQLFNGDVAGYSEQKVRSIRDIDIGTIPINCLLDTGVVQIRILSAS
jgi:hypothetical protein